MYCFFLNPAREFLRIFRHAVLLSSFDSVFLNCERLCHRSFKISLSYKRWTPVKLTLLRSTVSPSEVPNERVAVITGTPSIQQNPLSRMPGKPIPEIESRPSSVPRAGRLSWKEPGDLPNHAITHVNAPRSYQELPSVDRATSCDDFYSPSSPGAERKAWSSFWLRKYTLCGLLALLAAVVATLTLLWYLSLRQNILSISGSTNKYTLVYGPTAGTWICTELS